MISSIMPYVCLYSFYLFASWWLLNSLFEKRMQPELRKLPFYLFLFLFPMIASVLISFLLEMSPLAKFKADIDPNWISLCKSLAPVFMFLYALIWLYAVKCLKKKNEIFIPKMPTRRASDFAMYFTLGSTVFVLSVLPWALL